jgi:hypothetical protein
VGACAFTVMGAAVGRGIPSRGLQIGLAGPDALEAARALACCWFAAVPGRHFASIGNRRMCSDRVDALLNVFCAASVIHCGSCVWSTTAGWS